MIRTKVERRYVMGKLVNLTKEIMDPNHEIWEDFVWEMFQRHEVCSHNHETDRGVLQEMQGIEVDRTLEFFESEGGFCDCEVLLNLVAGNMPRSMQRGLMAYALGLNYWDEQETSPAEEAYP
jgi:hypothetical protein